MAHEHRMIEPFEDKQVRQGVISYGVSSYGYDVRVAVNLRSLPMSSQLQSTQRISIPNPWWLYWRRVYCPSQFICTGAHC